MFMVLIALVMSLVLMLAQLILSSISFISDPQLTSLESGFESIKYGVLMSSSFFLLGVLFVLFDVELILLMPLVTKCLLLGMSKVYSFWIVLSFVLLSLYFEWFFSGLKWSS